MNNSPVKSELYVALEMVELTQFLPFTNFSKLKRQSLWDVSFEASAEKVILSLIDLWFEQENSISIS